MSNKNLEASGGIRKKLSKALNITAVIKGENNSNESKVSPTLNKASNESKLLSSSSSDFEDDIQGMEILVHYLGYVEVKSPGFNEICDTVNKMYQRAKPYIKSLDKSLLALNRDGIRIKQDIASIKKDDVIDSTEGAHRPLEIENIYKPRRVLYCGVDKQHQRVFSFNYQFGARSENIHLHVVVCKTKDDARSVAKYLAQLFRRISKEVHQREKEDKQKHSEGLNKLKTKSNQSIHTYQNLSYPANSPSVTSIDSNESSCSGTCGSGEWLPDRIISQLSMAS